MSRACRSGRHRGSSRRRGRRRRARAGLVGDKAEVDGLLHVSGRLEGGGRVELQAMEAVRAVLLDGLLAQELPEEAVVAVRPILVGREREGAVRAKVGEDPVRSPRCADAIGEVGGHVVEAAGPAQEGPDLWRLTGVDLLGEVGEDVLAQPRVGERVLEGVDAHQGHRHGGEDDARRPALGEVGEGLGAHRRQALAGPARHTSTTSSGPKRSCSTPMTPNSPSSLSLPVPKAGS